MLHAESIVKLLESQNEITIGPCSKKMKSTEVAYEKLSDDDDNQGIQEEVDAERTSNNLVPVYASDNQGQHEMQEQEKIPTDILGTLNEMFPENNIALSPPVDSETGQHVNPLFSSINGTEVEEKGPFISNNTESSSALFSINRNASDEEFFTSKEFIGPVYKPHESHKQGKSGSCNECSSREGDQNELRENKGERKEAKTISSAVPEIDDELDQFYKEIHQLENENVDTHFQEKETETPQGQYSPPNCSQTSQEDYQRALLDGSQLFYENGHCFFREQNSQKTSSEEQFVMETSDWKTENTFNGQVDSKYSNYSVPEFRPAWQSTWSFAVPQGYLPPRFNHQSCFQILNSPLQKTNSLLSQTDEHSYKNNHDYHGNTDINSHGSLLDQSTNYAGCIDVHTTEVFRNGNSDQNGFQNNGFCETREECWKDPKDDNTERMHSFSSLQLPEERFSCSQKLLLLLRGLPGSGKSTLSRILLGQSRDGVVFSTDDYFRQQDGYTYNAAHLGDAHDWNQKRAKQAMEQGKSPVIIDNTNTQAWEMKPYVEAALEKGYRVEFHEPDTWWKFDPEELEKRNKHGVTREKIAQMLERYEYQVSIPIVMNSVAPPHKNPPRPPLQRRHSFPLLLVRQIQSFTGPLAPKAQTSDLLAEARQSQNLLVRPTMWLQIPPMYQWETILKQKPGHLCLGTKAKQRKKRKRNKKNKGTRTEVMKRMLGGAAHQPIPDGQEMSASEEDDLEEENSKSLCTLIEGPEEPVTTCAEEPNGDDESLKEAVVVSRERFPIAVSEVSMMPISALRNGLAVESDSSLLIDVKPFSAENLTKNNDEETSQRHKENVCRSSFLKISNDNNSIQDTEGISAEYNMPLLSIENKLKSYQIMCEADMEAKMLNLNGEEKETSQGYSSNIKDNVPDNNMEDKGALKAEESSVNALAFFTVDLPTEELQLGFDTQIFLSSWSEDKSVGEQRPQKVRKPKQSHMNSSAQLNCFWSNEGLVKENHQVRVTEEPVNAISSGLLAPPAGEMWFDSLMDARATSLQHSSVVSIPRNDAAPFTSKRKRYRRIVNLAPKFNLPRQIAGSTEGGKEVLIKDDIPQKSVLEAGLKSFLSKESGEECEQEYSAPNGGTEGTYSLPSPHADALLYDNSYIHSEQSSSLPKYSYRVCVASKTKEEQTRTKQQQVEDKNLNESEQVSSEVTNSQPDILSSVEVGSEYLEDSSILASCSEDRQETDDPELAEASQLEDDQDVNMKCSFLGLPLSLGFAFQLVQLFGSPGLPLESLLPDDFIVPLDWKVSKMIYLLWKTSVEEKQKTNGLQNGNALADDVISLENLNKNCHEKEDSSETLPDMELFEELIEENINILTYAGTGCLDAMFHQS